MKYSEVKKFILYSNPEDIEINFSDAVVRDTFDKRPERFGKSKEDYRDIAIKRLIHSEQTWETEGNIDYKVFELYVQVKCPYCGKMMNWYGHTGRMYVCECGAVANLPERYIRFDPPKEK